MRKQKECDIPKLIEAYQAGMTIIELQQRFGLSVTAIYRRLNAAGCDLRTTRLHDNAVGCPFFRAHSFAGVKCEVNPEWSSLTIGFMSSKDNERFRKRRCEGDYRHCPLFRLFSEADE